VTVAINDHRDDRSDQNGRPPATDIEAAAERLQAAMSEAAERADALTDDDVRRSLDDLLARAGVRRPEDGAPTIEEIDLDLFRLTWEIEYGAESALSPMRGDVDAKRSCRRVLRDDTFEELHGKHRQEYDPAPRIDVSANDEAGTLSATVIVAGVVAADVESVTVTVPTSKAGSVRIPLTIDRTDVRMVGTARLGGPIGDIGFPLRLELTRHGR
jgi:hypothetical protein